MDPHLGGTGASLLAAMFLAPLAFVAAGIFSLLALLKGSPRLQRIAVVCTVATHLVLLPMGLWGDVMRLGSSPLYLFAIPFSHALVIAGVQVRQRGR